LPKGIQAEALGKLFEEFGEITSVFVLKNESNEPLSNSGFVCFKEASSANEAVKKLNKQKQADGNYLLVSLHISKRDNGLTSEKSKQPINQSMTKNLNSCIYVK